MTAAPAVNAALPALPGRTGRGTELSLLAFATGLAVLGYASVGIAQDGAIPASAFSYALGFAILYGGAHLAVRRFAPYADPLILPCVALLNSLGVVVIRRLDLESAERARQAGRAVPGADAPMQMLWTTIGVLGFVALLALLRDHSRLSRYAYTCAAAGLVLLMLPAIPGVGATINGARLWIRLGPITIQPSEIAKILLMVFFASFLVPSATCCRWPAAASPGSTCPAPATSGRCCWPGPHRSRCWSARRTSARRCCSSASSS